VKNIIKSTKIHFNRINALLPCLCYSLVGLLLSYNIYIYNFVISCLPRSLLSSKLSFIVRNII